MAGRLAAPGAREAARQPSQQPMNMPQLNCGRQLAGCHARQLNQAHREACCPVPPVFLDHICFEVNGTALFSSPPRVSCAAPLSYRCLALAFVRDAPNFKQMLMA